MNKRNKSAGKRFGRVLAWAGLAIGALELTSLCVSGVMAIKPEWAVAGVGLTATVLAIEKWIRWHKDEIESGKHQDEAGLLDRILGKILPKSRKG